MMNKKIEKKKLTIVDSFDLFLNIKSFFKWIKNSIFNYLCFIEPSAFLLLSSVIVLQLKPLKINQKFNQKKNIRSFFRA